MFEWFRLFNEVEFLALNLPSFEAEVILGDRGVRKILIVRGRMTSVVYEGEMLSLYLNDKNPFRLGELAIWRDAFSDVWLGIYKEVAE